MKLSYRTREFLSELAVGALEAFIAGICFTAGIGLVVTVAKVV